jgi:hypothetical protein
MNRVVLFIALALLSTACRSTTALFGIDSFFRPETVDFACYDRSQNRVVAMSRCAEDTDDEEVGLLALVTQWARGQVAAVDLVAGKPVDASQLIPGFTYVNVGVSPTGIVHVDPSAVGPAVTVIASYGARRLETLETGVFHPDIPAESGDGRFLRSALTLPEAPTDVVFLPTDAIAGARGLVVVAIPGLGSIGTIALLDDGTLDDASLTLLPVSDAPATPVGGGLVDEADPWQRICPPTRAPHLAHGVAAAPVFLHDPAPHRLRVDTFGDDPVVLVADEGVPFIHRFALDEGALIELDAIATPVPLLDLTVTPALGRDLVDPPDMPGSERLLYGIDATDRSVLVLDYDETSATFGDALAVQSGEGPSDRLFFRSGATRVEVLTPGFARALDPDSSDFGLCPSNVASRAELARPDRMRGVFLGVALANGQIQFVDIWDLDATCRGGNALCQSPSIAEDVIVSIRRNRPRQASFVNALPRVTGTPTLRYGASPGRITESGEPATGDGPGLTPFPSCPGDDYYLQGYPDAEEFPGATPLVCLARDPWSGAVQRFTATWEGRVPGSGFEGARIVDGPNGRPSLVVPSFDFCGVGALGVDNVVDAGLDEVDPEAGYQGDFVFISAPLPFAREDAPECAKFRIPESGTRPPALLRVLDAARGRLDLGDGPNTTVAEVRACFTQPFGGHLQVRDAYVVRASVTLTRHRVVEDAEERCTLDTAERPFDPEDPRSAMSFRALEGRPFVHPLVAFTISAPGEGDEGLLPGSTTEAELVIDVGRVPSTLGLPNNGNVRDLAWNDIDQRFYAVNTSGNSLLRIRADRLAITERLD